LPVGLAVAAVLPALLLGACDSGDGTTLRPPDTTATGSCAVDPALFADAEGIFALRSPDFTIDGPIPPRYGAAVGTEGRWPELLWHEVPAGSAELALVLADDETGDVHWIVGGLDPTAGCIPAGELPPGAVTYPNSAGVAAYDPPDLSPGDPKRFYVFRLYALDAPLTGVPVDIEASALVEMLDASTEVTTVLVGTSADA
jgi:phosphatidylethanolamine-binding protein (PEBP) family uncharacterized protein